ncbi:MAG: hypothetical protein JRI70_09575 [Deltaproteobacteria bacterium]|nr:hypothetical protein [Deltaproteobacteria bacterium]
MTGVMVSYNSGYQVGGILCEDASPTLTGCTISYNSTFSGGNDKDSTSRGAAQMGGPAYTGGAAFLGGSPTLSGCTVTYNTGFDVGGIFNAESLASLTISGGAVTFNRAWGNPGEPFSVGGVSTFGGSPTITGGNISFNSAWFGVGGVRCADSIASPTLSGVTIDNNEGEVTGGINFFESSGTIEDCNVTNNTATSCGPGPCHAGGIAIFGPSDVEINRTYVTQNQGSTGGIFTDGTNSPSVTNSVITGNTGTSFVGGVGLLEAEISLMNCTIADNTGAAAGGIGSEDDSVISVRMIQ